MTTFIRLDAQNRVRIQPSASNGLEHPSYVMTDKIASVPKIYFGKKTGELDSKDMTKVEQSLKLILGLEN